MSEPRGEHNETRTLHRFLPTLAAAIACVLATPAATLAIRLLNRFDDGETPSQDSHAQPLSASLRAEPIPPLAAPAGLDADKVALGKALFHDPGLSSTGAVSCASCHTIADGGDDGRSVSEGVGGALGDMNAPTVLNSSLNFRQFWDGRVATLEEQAAGPIHSTSEMDSSWEEVIAYLRSSAAYADWFERVYDDGLTDANVAGAIAEYERSLVTVDSPFDRWLKGDDDALSDAQKHGYAVFKEFGCVSCHQGANVGGNTFQPLGVMVEYFDAASDTPKHLGRFNVTGDERDRHVFKVPGLRNVSRTAPYFHDGSAATIEDAVRAMFEHQLGMPTDEETVGAVCDFLESLSAENDRRPL